MGWFALLRGIISLAVSITRHMERKGYIQQGAAQSELKALKEAQVRIHNAEDAYNNTPIDLDSVRRDRSNRDRH